MKSKNNNGSHKKEEEIGRLLSQGASPAQLIRQGYGRSTVYKVSRRLSKEATTPLSPASAATSAIDSALDPTLEADPEIVELKKTLRKAQLQRQMAEVKAPIDLQAQLKGLEEEMKALSDARADLEGKQGMGSAPGATVDPETMARLQRLESENAELLQQNLAEGLDRLRKDFSQYMSDQEPRTQALEANSLAHEAKVKELEQMLCLVGLVLYHLDVHHWQAHGFKPDLADSQVELTDEGYIRVRESLRHLLAEVFKDPNVRKHHGLLTHDALESRWISQMVDETLLSLHGRKPSS